MSDQVKHTTAHEPPATAPDATAPDATGRPATGTTDAPPPGGALGSSAKHTATGARGRRIPLGDGRRMGSSTTATRTKKGRPNAPRGKDSGAQEITPETVHTEISRRALAKLLNVHQDTLSRLMPDGLASAVVKWGGHGAPMVFSKQLALRFFNAKDCTALSGRPCPTCRNVQDDARYMAEHLMQGGHGYRGCEECQPPPRLCQPCRQVAA